MSHPSSAEWLVNINKESNNSAETPTEKNGFEKTTKMPFTVVLRAIRHKEGIEKVGSKFGLNPVDLIQQTQKTYWPSWNDFKESSWISDLEILKIDWQVNREENAHEEATIRIETQNTENQILTEPKTII